MSRIYKIKNANGLNFNTFGIITNETEQIAAYLDTPLTKKYISASSLEHNRRDAMRLTYDVYMSYPPIFIYEE